MRAERTAPSVINLFSRGDRRSEYTLDVRVAPRHIIFSEFVHVIHTQSRSRGPQPLRPRDLSRAGAAAAASKKVETRLRRFTRGNTWPGSMRSKIAKELFVLYGRLDTL